MSAYLNYCGMIRRFSQCQHQRQHVPNDKRTATLIYKTIQYIVAVAEQQQRLTCLHLACGTGEHMKTIQSISNVVYLGGFYRKQKYRTRINYISRLREGAGALASLHYRG